MKWWNDLWLNEGFATFMEYKGADAVQPDWDMHSQFTQEDLTIALKLDGLDSSHPIIQPVNHPDQINEIFDPVSYKKVGTSPSE
jgi:aminopeptidase N